MRIFFLIFPRKSGKYFRNDTRSLPKMVLPIHTKVRTSLSSTYKTTLTSFHIKNTLSRMFPSKGYRHFNHHSLSLLNQDRSVTTRSVGAPRYCVGPRVMKTHEYPGLPYVHQFRHPKNFNGLFEASKETTKMGILDTHRDKTVSHPDNSRNPNRGLRERPSPP